VLAEIAGDNTKDPRECVSMPNSARDSILDFIRTYILYTHPRAAASAAEIAYGGHLGTRMIEFDADSYDENRRAAHRIENTIGPHAVRPYGTA